MFVRVISCTQSNTNRLYTCDHLINIHDTFPFTSLPHDIIVIQSHWLTNNTARAIWLLLLQMHLVVSMEQLVRQCQCMENMLKLFCGSYRCHDDYVWVWIKCRFWPGKSVVFYSRDCWWQAARHCHDVFVPYHQDVAMEVVLLINHYNSAVFLDVGRVYHEPLHLNVIRHISGITGSLMRSCWLNNSWTGLKLPFAIGLFWYWSEVVNQSLLLFAIFLSIFLTVCIICSTCSFDCA